MAQESPDRSVLVCEDDPAMVRIFQFLLRQQGIRGVEPLEAGEIRDFGFNADPFHDFLFRGESEIDEPLRQILVRSVGGGDGLMKLFLRNDADFNENFAEVGMMTPTGLAHRGSEQGRSHYRAPPNPGEGGEDSAEGLASGSFMVSRKCLMRVPNSIGSNGLIT